MSILDVQVAYTLTRSRCSTGGANGSLCRRFPGGGRESQQIPKQLREDRRLFNLCEGFLQRDKRGVEINISGLIKTEANVQRDQHKRPPVNPVTDKTVCNSQSNYIVTEGLG